MKYEYVYKTADGARHVEEMESLSREAVFEVLRAKGIRPIKVIAKDGSKANGEVRVIGVRRRVLILLVLLAAVAVGSIGGFLTLRIKASGPRHPGQQQAANGADKKMVAAPLPRQMIQGDRSRIENAPTNLFETAVETYLSQFAEPGRKIPRPEMDSINATNLVELSRILDAPIVYADDEFSEYIDLKRITAGIKKEMRAYVRGGHTPNEYFAALIKRQETEIAYRNKASEKLKEMLSDVDSAYVFWLKANAQLQSMGIFPLPLPDALKMYQSDFDLKD